MATLNIQAPIDEETIKPLIQKAQREAMNLLLEMPIFIEDMLEEYIKKAEANAYLLNSLIFGSGISAPIKETTPKIKKKEPKKEEEEEPTGIGGLF